MKELPKLINKRLLVKTILQSKKVNKAKPFYEEVLSESNYKASRQFEKPRYSTNKNRLRKVFYKQLRRLTKI